MKYRTLGRTGLEVSIFGFGGIIVMNTPQDKANKIVADAVNSGVNIFDVGPTYGNAEEIMGPAIEPYRDDIVLTCKTEPDQTKDEVRRDIENSLKLLKTDYFDVYQLHEVTDESALEQALGPDGALEAIIEAKEEGLINYIGFSAHSEWAALKLMDSYDFDTVMFPINWNYWNNYNQGQKVIKEARKTDKGIIAIKALAHRQWREDDDKNDYNVWYKPLFDNDELAELALKFTISQNIDTAISPGDIRMFNKGLDIINQYGDNIKLSDSELSKLKEYAETQGGELYPIP